MNEVSNYGRAYKLPTIIKRPPDYYLRIAVAMFSILVPQFFIGMFFLVKYFKELPDFPSIYFPIVIKNIFRPNPAVSKWIAEINQLFMVFEVVAGAVIIALVACVIWFFWVIRAQEETVVHRGTKVDTDQMHRALRNYK